MTEWLKGNALEKRRPWRHHAARRLSGGLNRGSKVAEIYGATEISERHRHRYEVNTAYKDRLEQHGMRFCGMSPDGVLPEIIEYADHPWFIGVQFHPELNCESRTVRRIGLSASRTNWSGLPSISSPWSVQ